MDGGKSNWLIGGIIIGLGILMLLNNLGVTNISVGYIVSNYWPVILIIWGAQFLFQRKKGFGEVLTGVVLVLLGVVILAKMNNVLDIDLSYFWKLFWPVILILVGLSFLRGPKPVGRTNWAFMGGFEKGKEQWKLEDGNYWAIMGGIKLDLRNALLENNQYTITCNAIMGGIEIIAPKDITIICEGSAVLGGVEMLGEGAGGIVSSMKGEQIYQGTGSPVVIKIYARAFMGGVEVKAKDR